MGTWKDFITEIPIINKKAEGIFVKADHVLDLWGERNQLREEVARLKAGAPPTPPVTAEPPTVPVLAEVSAPPESAIREQCAREIEELAAAYPCDAELHGFVADLIRAATNRLRGIDEVEAADFLSHVAIPPAPPLLEALPLAEMIEEWPVTETIPAAEPVNPFDFGQGNSP